MVKDVSENRPQRIAAIDLGSRMVMNLATAICYQGDQQLRWSQTSLHEIQISRFQSRRTQECDLLAIRRSVEAILQAENFKPDSSTIACGVGGALKKHDWNDAFSGLPGWNTTSLVPSIFSSASLVSKHLPSTPSPSAMLVIDGNASETSYALLSKGALIAQGDFGVGCAHVINDVSLAMGVSMKEARARIARCFPGEVINAEGAELHDRLSPSLLIRMRLEEMTGVLLRNLRKANLDPSWIKHGVLVGDLRDIPGATQLFGSNLQIAMMPVPFEPKISILSTAGDQWGVWGLLDLATECRLRSK